MTNTLSIPKDPREATTFPQMIRSAAALYGDELFGRLEDGEGTDSSLTFRQIEARSAQLARGFLARGIGKGTRVGFIYGNSPAFVIVMAALARIGAVAIPISTLIKGNELVRVLRQCDVGTLIVQRQMLGRDYVERLCEALPGLADAGPGPLFLPRTPYLRRVYSTGDGLPASVDQFDDIFADADKVPEEILHEAECEVHSSDQMIEIYTSGSMALPKGVKHNHGPVLFRAEYVGRMQGAKRGVEGYCFLPMFWVGGLTITLMPNWVHGAPTLFTSATRIDSRSAMGTVLSDEDMANMGKNMFKPYWGLGMTETLGPYSYGDDFRAPGRPMCAPMDHFAERYDIRVADENDQQVADGEIGEMQVRGYPVTPGFHKIEKSEMFTADGYFHTGDLCLVDGSRVHFVGRSGDMIKTASSNVSPAEVELEMQTLPEIENAYVTGLPDKDRGQIVAAAVIASQGVGELDFAAIEAQLRRNMSGYKVPRAYVQIQREELPMLHSNKVSKRLLADLMIQKLGRK